jgi:dihydrofolate synthase/folylpolyglutamate synthase
VSAYTDVLARLVSARRFGMKLGLERMRELLDRLGAPDRRLGTVVHVGGTNGKGSTVAMIAALARGCGKRVATYTSPHLSTLRERITINGEMVSEAAIVDAAARIGESDLTFFEQITAIAMLIIADAQVDVTVLEVGLGGRLDATNVVNAPVAVITGVAMDHEAILGNTLDAIAFEKAGIIKRGQRVVIGASGEPDAVPLLVQAAYAAEAARVTVVDDSMIARVPPVALPGAHQRANAAAALAVLDDLEMSCDIADVLAHVTHPGRFEVIGDVILDGAHNPHGAHALAATLRERGIRPILVTAISNDKDVRAIAEAFIPHVAGVVATRYQQERAMDPDALIKIFRDVPRPVGGAPQQQAMFDAQPRTTPSFHLETAPDLASAIAIARMLGSPILVAGSLFLVGEARVLLLGAPADPIALSDPSNLRK